MPTADQVRSKDSETGVGACRNSNRSGRGPSGGNLREMDVVDSGVSDGSPANVSVVTSCCSCHRGVWGGGVIGSSVGRVFATESNSGIVGAESIESSLKRSKKCE
jgi:hypothetical protein